MRAITVIPAQQGSVALTEMPEPPDEDGPILVQTQAIGICGTDLEIINGDYGSAPSGEDRLIIGHESLGRVLEAPPGTGFDAGDLVVGIVRRRDPVPCPACAAGDWDMCMNGRYTERGIKGRHGYASERYRIHPDYLVAMDPVLGILGVLLEPTTVVAKAWDHIEKIGHRASWAPEKVLITGAGPIGLLAALLATQRGYQTYVLDRVTEGRKPEMVRRLGATYFHVGDLGEAGAEADIVIECTGFVQMLLRAGGVDDEVGAEVGLLLEALHVVLVELALGLPVEVAQLVAGRVLAVLGELDRLPVVGRAVEAGEHALGDRADAQLQAAELGEDGGVQQGAGAVQV